MTVDGLISTASVDPFAATVKRLEAFLADRKIAPMLRWDHAAAAAQVGLVLRPSLLIVFGDPRSGTPLMQEQPTTGIDLPLKLLIWEGEGGTVWISYNDPTWVRTRHGLENVPNASKGMAALLHALVMTTAGADVV